MGITIREAYGNALAKYGRGDDRIVVLDADVSSSTKSGIFAAACPERLFNVGICEQNMVAMAAGMAAAGKIPFVNTFAVFLATLGSLSARELIAYADLNVKLIGAYGGLSDSYDGASHHSIEDLAFFRAIPGMTVLVASDEVLTENLIRLAVETPGPMYIRLSRDEMEHLYPKDETFAIGKGKVLRDGSDVVIFACGVMSGRALEAAKLLAEKGIRAAVVDLFSLKPVDAELIRRYAQKTGAVVAAEEHNVIGGLGSSVAEVLADAGLGVKLERIGVQDTFTESGSYAALSKKYHLLPEDIAAAAERAAAAKRQHP
ncbi:transketolase family protein [Anaerotruncus rubiinfantis]|uniref:transketolase family protein n=1 Tax=Anaerotruncus rubiinfantis TaxID=1720200 RepID=UPI0034A29DA9